MQPPFLEDCLGILAHPQVAQDGDVDVLLAPFEPGHQAIRPQHEGRNTRRFAHGQHALPRFVDPSRQPEADHANPLVAARSGNRRLGGQKPLQLAGEQERLLDTGRDVGIQPARLRVRGHRLLEQPAVAAGVHQAGEQLRIVAVTACLADQPHDRAARRCPVSASRFA